MTPKKVWFYVYAENDSQIEELESSLRDLVMTQYNKGILVTADGLSKVVRNNCNNPMITLLMK